MLVATTFPVYHALKTIVGEIDGVEVKLLIPAELGCPHEFALRPRDVQLIAQADAIWMNGLGMDNFLMDAFGTDPSGNRRVFEACTADMIPEGFVAAQDSACDHPDHDHHHHHHHGHDAHGAENVNPHLFASPATLASMVHSIADQVAEYLPDHAAAFRERAEGYAKELRELDKQYAVLANTSAGRVVMEQHDTFAYLWHRLGWQRAAVIDEHRASEHSAANTIDTVRAIREKQVNLLVSEAQFSRKRMDMLASETGVAVVQLQSGASGPEDASPDFMIQSFRENLRLLEEAL